MSYLRFEKALMTNMEESLPRELLRTNRSGAYSCSTIVDCNTRKYHGLLVVPVPEIDDENHVLLSSLDVTVVQHGAEFNLGLHKYQGNNFSPKGHKYIREFDCDKVPTTIYRVGGVVLKKEVVFQHYEDRILIRYTLVDAHSDTKLLLRPLWLSVVSDSLHMKILLPHENTMKWRTVSVHACMQAILSFTCSLAKRLVLTSSPIGIVAWNILRSKSVATLQTRTFMSYGYFEVDIKKGESIVFSGSTSECKPRGLSHLFQKEVDERSPRDKLLPLSCKRCTPVP